MTASAADIAYGLVFKGETAASSGVYFTFEEVTDLTPPNSSVDVIDVTHMGSANRTREFIQGLIDPGTMSVTMNYVPGSDTDEYILAWRAAAEVRSCKIEHENGTVQTLSAFPTGYAPSLPMADKMSATLELKVTSSVAQA